MTFVDVNWATRAGRLILQDELDLLPPIEVPPRYSSYDEPTEEELYYRQTAPELVAVIYRQLATSFEKSRNHDLAESCTVAVWEMKRRDPTMDRWDAFASGVYRVASVYGSSFWRALMILGALVCIAFPLFYSAPFIPVIPTSSAAGTVANVPDPHAHTVFESQFQHWTSLSREYIGPVGTKIGRALLLSVETATFSRNPAYTAGSLLGRLLVALESILVAGQAALFLLALRRRFRH
jgi:hypothetical protein